MSAPISKKAGGAAAGVTVAGGVGITLVELLGQLPVLDGASPALVKALGGLIVLIVSAYGASWGAWLTKESDDFVAYAAGEAGKVLVDASKAGVIPVSDVAGLEAKIDALAVRFDSKAEEDAEKLLTHYASTMAAVSTGVIAEPVPPVAEPEPAPVAPEVPAAPETPAAPADPVLADDAPPAVETDPVLAD